MPKKKQLLVTPSTIDFVKTYIPYVDEDYWYKVNVSEKIWQLPTKFELKAAKKPEEEWDESYAGKKIKKLKLKYTQQEVKKAIQEDEKSLKDVEKLEEHLEEDIDKAKEKLSESKK
jgi:hypothetical protein